jgi:hypothetical protein
MGKRRCAKTSVTNYLLTPYNIPEELPTPFLTSVHKEDSACCVKLDMTHAGYGGFQNSTSLYLYILPPASNGPENSVEDT